ncbi:hypothetical protein [Duganella callida]|uniref:Uncharacterized protein n=1 Tax=Duganella callida TaxID=2561932 RepID=A0A4Y9S8P0_9BURK|nr:hypothetical protein [Duganella callida]TFW17969.1 hypothetical protein E4L98_19175 [Duganella callida]
MSKKTRQPRAVTDPDQVQKIGRFLDDSANDYIAARTLLLNQLPQQGAILGSTAIEKAFKAILVAYGQPPGFGHLQVAHWNQVKNLAPDYFKLLNRDFLKLNQKVYLLRYTDAVPVGYNIVIASREYLWELDKTIMSLQRRFVTQAEEGKTRLRKIEALIQENDRRILTDNNFVFDTNDNVFDYTKPQLIYELRRHAQHALIELQYVADTVPVDAAAGFLRAGAHVAADDRTVTQAFARIGHPHQ